jgi:hypothetical protein
MLRRACTGTLYIANNKSLPVSESVNPGWGPLAAALPVGAVSRAGPRQRGGGGGGGGGSAQPIVGGARCSAAAAAAGCPLRTPTVRRRTLGPPLHKMPFSLRHEGHWLDVVAGDI